MKRVLIVAMSVVLGLSACATTPPTKRQFVVFFETDSATLSDQGKLIVGNVAQIAQTTKSSKIAVEGQADGATAHDATLADSRGLAVVTALTNAGIPVNRIVKKPSVPPEGLDGVVAHKVVITLIDSGH